MQEQTAKAEFVCSVDDNQPILWLVISYGMIKRKNLTITNYFFQMANPVRLPSDNNVVTERKSVVTNEGYGQVWINKKQIEIMDEINQVIEI